MSGFIKKLYPMSLVLQGFSYRSAKEFSSIRKSVNEAKAKSVMRLLPFNVTFDKMFADLLTTRRVLWEARDSFPKLFAMLAKRDESVVICPLEDCGTKSKLSVSDLISLLKSKVKLCVRPCYNDLKGKIDRLEFSDGAFMLNGSETDESALSEYFTKLSVDSIIMQGSDPSEKFGCMCPVLHYISVRDHNLNESTACYIADHSAKKGRWSIYSGYQNDQFDQNDPDIVDAIHIAKGVCRKYPEAPYLNVGVMLTNDKPLIWQIDVGKELIWLNEIPSIVDEFLEKQNINAVQPIKHKERGLKRIGNYAFAAYAKNKGFLDYMYRNWLRGVKDDNLVKSTTTQEKRWAHKRGFYSYRIKQYGLTEENYREMLSDYEYKRLRPINGWYQKWLWDKVFMYYVMAPYHDMLPKHYYRIVPLKTENRLISFDLTESNEPTVQDLFVLVRDKKKLVAKPAIGSHGHGFYKLEWDDTLSGVKINGTVYTEDAFSDFIGQLDKLYFVTEFVEMHDELKRIYDGVVGTVRLMVIDIGEYPKVESAYMRIGSSRTGHTDNLDSGGLVTRVNASTGKYDEAEMLTDHEYVLCDVHPDTGAKLEGFLPNWDYIKESVADIAAYLYPLEYLGFDVVITQNGFQILEINTHQDLHRYPEYPQEVKDYFKRKIALKNKKK